MPRTAILERAPTDHPVLGRLPEGWKPVRLGDLFDFRNGYNTSKEHYGSGTPFVNVLEVISHPSLRIEQITGKVNIPPEALGLNDVRLGDVLFNRTSEVPEEVGLACVYLSEEVVCFGGFVIRARPKTTRLDPDYLTYALRATAIRKQIIALGTGAIRSNIGQSDLEDVLMAIPPLPEQRRIARILGTWDKAINLLGQQISAKEERLRGLIDQLVSGARHGAKGNTLPKGWRWVSLGELGSFKKGKGVLKNDIRSEGVPAVTYGELYTVHHVRIKRFYSFVEVAVADGSQPIQRNDLLFAGSGETAEEIGKAAVYLGDERACAGGDVIILRPDGINSVYLATALNSAIADRQRLKFGQGHSVVHIYPSQLAEMEVPLPPPEVQEFIANATTALDDELDILRTKLQQLHDQKRGLMQRLLSGGNIH